MQRMGQTWQITARQLVFALRARLDSASERLEQRMQTRLSQSRARLNVASRTLDTMGPQATLARGYAIVTHGADGTIARDSRDLTQGDALNIRLAAGRAGVIVTETDHDE